MAKSALLIILYGPSCTGKTTLGKKIAKEFNLPFIHLDGIKENLFETFGFIDGDYKWSKKLAKSSYGLLFYISEILLSANVSHIIEATFNPDFANKQFYELRKKQSFRPLQLELRANKKIILNRYKKRHNSGERHPGHFLDKIIAETNSTNRLKEQSKSLDIGTNKYIIDTTEPINYEELFNLIKDHLENSE